MRSPVVFALVALLPLARAYALLSPARAPTVSPHRCATPLLEAAAEPVTSMPPDSFQLLLDQAAASTEAAIADGQLLIEVEFPPVPVSKLEDSSLSAYDILSANLQFALEYVKRLEKDASGVPKKVALTLPDAAERTRAAKFFGDSEPWPGMQLWSLNGADKAAEEGPMAFFGSIFKQGSGAVQPAEWADMHLIVGASCQELPAIQRLAELTPGKPLVCFNLKLDVLRGDLGLPAFPSKAVHHDFLCKVKPVYYLRPRSYSLSLSVPPFLVAYQGVLFRRYPEGWQTLLDKGKTSYRRVELSDDRPNLGTFKSQLTSALKLSDDKAMKSAISSAGFKQSTWWEDDKDRRDVSKAWKQ